MNKALETILIVDDTETNIDILLELLDEYDVVVATDGPSALEITHNETINLILLDIMMPGMDGYEVCTNLKADQKTKDIPVIFITAKTDEESIEKAYDVGGIDYVTKPFKPKELLARVKTQLDIRTLIENLHYIANHDQMTGIYNRRKFFELAQKMFASPKPLYCAMMDIDKFKNINDTFGHPVGDTVIKTITAKISSLIKENHIFGRLGGEEFAIVYQGETLEDVRNNIELIRKEVAALEIKTEDEEVIKTTISIGLSERVPGTRNIDHLLKEADDRLYEAKNSGRNKTIFRI